MYNPRTLLAFSIITNRKRPALSTKFKIKDEKYLHQKNEKGAEK